MEKPANNAKVYYYRNKHRRRMTAAGLDLTEVYCHPDDIQKLKDFIEALNKDRGIPKSWHE